MGSWSGGCPGGTRSDHPQLGFFNLPSALFAWKLPQIRYSDDTATDHDIVFLSCLTTTDW